MTLVFDMALEKRFDENTELTSIDANDVFLVKNISTDEVVRIKFSTLAAALVSVVFDSLTAKRFKLPNAGADVTLPSTGEGMLGTSSAGGLVVISKGSVNDYTHLNQAGNLAFRIPAGSQNLEVGANIIQNGGTVASSISNFDGTVFGLTATLGNSPVAGDPTKWLVVNDNGTLRRFPSWS